jgi:hypothetical protein
MIPFKTMQVLAVFVSYGIITKENSGKLLEDLTDDLAIGGAEVSSEGLATRDDELFSNDVRECPYEIGVDFYLPKGQLNIIGMTDNILGGVVSTESVDVSQDFFLN